MPAYQEPEAEVDELSLPTQPDCRVWMKRYATRGDIFDAEEYVLNTQRAGTEKQIGMSDNYRVALLQAITLKLIVDWNIEDASGARWEINFLNLRRLHGADGAFLEIEANKRIEVPSGPFVNGSQPPSRDTTSTIPTSSEPSSSTTGGEQGDGPQTSSVDNGTGILKRLRSSSATGGS